MSISLYMCLYFIALVCTYIYYSCLTITTISNDVTNRRTNDIQWIWNNNKHFSFHCCLTPSVAAVQLQKFMNELFILIATCAIVYCWTPLYNLFKICLELLICVFKASFEGELNFILVIYIDYLTRKYFCLHTEPNSHWASSKKIISYKCDFDAFNRKNSIA